jgi:hypothetical protein
MSGCWIPAITMIELKLITDPRNARNLNPADVNLLSGSINEIEINADQGVGPIRIPISFLKNGPHGPLHRKFHISFN